MFAPNIFSSNILETPRRRGRFSRSSSRSRCSSRNSAYASDAELAEELSECVRDLVKEVKELVHRSRDPSPVLTRNPPQNTGISQKFYFKLFQFNSYLASWKMFAKGLIFDHKSDPSFTTISASTSISTANGYPAYCSATNNDPASICSPANRSTNATDLTDSSNAFSRISESNKSSNGSNQSLPSISTNPTTSTW